MRPSILPAGMSCVLAVYHIRSPPPPWRTPPLTSPRRARLSAADSPQPDDELGPIDFLAVEFPHGEISAPGFEMRLTWLTAA